MNLLERIFGGNGPEASYEPQPEPIRDEADFIGGLDGFMYEDEARGLE